MTLKTTQVVTITPFKPHEIHTPMSVKRPVIWLPDTRKT